MHALFITHTFSCFVISASLSFSLLKTSRGLSFDLFGATILESKGNGKELRKKKLVWLGKYLYRCHLVACITISDVGTAGLLSSKVVSLSFFLCLSLSPSLSPSTCGSLRRLACHYLYKQWWYTSFSLNRVIPTLRLTCRTYSNFFDSFYLILFLRLKE